jgi:hypothetical protein
VGLLALLHAGKWRSGTEQRGAMKAGRRRPKEGEEEKGTEGGRRRPREAKDVLVLTCRQCYSTPNSSPTEPKTKNNVLTITNKQ